MQNLDFYNLNAYPSLILTGYAGFAQWDLFMDTGPYSGNAYQSCNNHDPWYSTYRKSINFLNGTMWAIITNKTCPISLLPSFSSLFPSLIQNIQLGRFI